MSAATGYEQPLYVLAFDHRDAFRERLGARLEADAIADAKRVIFEGFLHAVEDGVPREAAGVLVDEEFGAGVAREAAAGGVVLAMPVERSGRDEFELEYGDDFGAHLDAFDVRFAKALVHYDAGGDRALNERQGAGLARLSDWLHGHGRLLMLELLVPPASGLELVLRGIEELRAAGVEPDVWKLEGLDSEDACRQVAELARAGGRERVGCVVLGRGADEQAVERRLRAAAATPGWVGFAVGRTIWGPPLERYLAGDAEREQTAREVGGRYGRLVDVYRG